MVKRGMTPVTKVLDQSLTPADAKVASHLQIEQGDPIIKIHRLRGVEDKFIILDTSYLPYAICPDVLKVDLSSQSLYAFLEEKSGLKIARSQRTLEAILASDYEAKLLQINIGAPLIF